MIRPSWIGTWLGWRSWKITRQASQPQVTTSYAPYAHAPAGTSKSSMFAVPNVFLSLLQAAAWLFWRDPVAKSDTKPKARPPRRPTLCYTVGTIPPDLLAVIRISWFRKGTVYEVEQYEVAECPDAMPQFHYLVGTALKQGADVCVLTSYAPADLGVPEP